MQSVATDRIDTHAQTSAVRGDPDQSHGRSRLSQLRAPSKKKTGLILGPSIRGAVWCL